MKASFEIAVNGEVLCVEIDYDTIEVDDSFNCHKGGVDAVEERWHIEVDQDSWTIEQLTNSLGEDVLENMAICKAIGEHLADMDCDA